MILCLRGHSHSQRVSGSLLTVLAYQKVLPQVVVCNKKGEFRTTYSLHHQLLVIENLELFLALIEQPDLVAEWLDTPWPCDIVYADGNRISNQLHRQFLSQYDTIRCLLDIDLGGLSIFKNLDNLLDNKTVIEFVLSDYYLKKHRQYAYNYNNEAYKKLINFQCPVKLQAVYKLLKEDKRYSEQEVLLAE